MMMLRKAVTAGVKILAVTLLIAGINLFCCSCGCASYSIDGWLDDWGITPFTDWTPWDSRVDYVEEDWTEAPAYATYIGHGSYPGGGEPCDIEALYFDDDPNFIYLAMVTSHPFVTENGDLAIGFGCTDYYQFGMKIEGIDEYGLMYVPLKKLWPSESWTYTFDPNAGPVSLASGVGEDIGLAEIYYWNASGLGPYNEPNTTRETWVMEAKMNRLLFDGLTQEGNTVQFNHTMPCANDYIRLCGDFDSPPVPEPASLLLLGSGLLGLLGLRKRKRF